MQMLKKLLSVLFFAVIAAASTIYYFMHREDFYLITSVSMGALIAISAPFIVISLCFGLQLKIIMNHYKRDIGFLECYGLTRTSSFINLLLPFGGSMSFKAVYLKKLLKLRYSSFIASMAIANIIKIMIFALIAVFLVMPLGGVLSAVSITTFSASLLFLFLGHKLKKLDITSSGHVRKIIDEWQLFKEDRSTIANLGYLSLVFFAATSFSIYLSFRAFSVDIPLRAGGTIAAFTAITGLMNLVPGNLGIREAVIIAISRIYGIEVNESVHAAALGRLVQIIWTFILAASFRYNFSRKNLHILTSSSRRKGLPEE
jgi:uncharacterized membrane protein YbhN (UPF0104 family)